MSLASPENLFKTAAFLYALTVPGHVLMGYQVVYKALDKIPKQNLEDRIGERGAANCWNVVTTLLAANALLNWQWARTGGPATNEELAVLGLSNIHTFVNGIRYMQVGEYKAGLAVTAPSVISLVAFLLQRQAQ